MPSYYTNRYRVTDGVGLPAPIGRVFTSPLRSAIGDFSNIFARGIKIGLGGEGERESFENRIGFLGGYYVIVGVLCLQATSGGGFLYLLKAVRSQSLTLIIRPT